MKTKLNSDADFLLNKSLKFHAMTISITSVFQEVGKLYPQKCYSTTKLMFQKKLTLTKQAHQKNVCFVITGTLKMLDLNLNHMFVTNITMY